MPRKKGVPYVRDALKERHAFSITRKAYNGFKRLAASLGVPMSAVLEAVGRGEVFVSKVPKDFKELMASWDMDELAELAGIPIERLQEISEGKGDRVQPHELIGLESATGVAYEVLDRLVNKGEHQSNGC